MAEYRLHALFNLLLRKETTVGLVDDGGVRIPDTVAFRHGMLVGWYHFDEVLQDVVKRDRKYCISEEIYRVFVRGARPKQPCVARLMYRDGAERERHPDDPERVPIAVRFLTAKELKEFLGKGYQSYDGILQRFVLPKTETNSVVQVQWSPHTTLVSWRRNLHKLFADRGASVYDRCTTHECRKNSCEVHVTPQMTERYSHECLRIAQRVSAAGRGPLRQMVVFFKADPRDRIFCLWALVLVFRPPAPLAA
eukprot:RCo050520